jgi:addiction module HigA family antidote
VIVAVTMDDPGAGRVDFGAPIKPGASAFGRLHPGGVLRDCGMSAYALTKALRLPVNRVPAVLAGKRAVTADTALRLPRRIGTSPEPWLSLRARFDLEMTRAARAAAIEAEVQPRAA